MVGCINKKKQIALFVKLLSFSHRPFSMMLEQVQAAFVSPEIPL
jgi:hypothetical protein